MQCPEIEQPGEPRGDSGQREKKPCPAMHLTNLPRDARADGDSPCEYENDRHANGGCEIRIDILDAEFSEYRRQLLEIKRRGA